MVEHNVPFAVSDHLSPLFCDVFTDSQIAKHMQALEQRQQAC